jgi:hypothetical protein
VTLEQEAVRSRGLCGALSLDRAHICIQSADEPHRHAWEGTDLSAEDVGALRWLRDTLVSERPYHSSEFRAARNEPAIAVLDKLIAGAPR